MYSVRDCPCGNFGIIILFHHKLRLEEEVARLEQMGIIHAVRYKEDLDEATGAYKNIDEVMDAQSDLVKIRTKLIPIAVIKG